MNAQCEKPFTLESIIDALFQMCTTKALAPNSLPAIFFQKNQQTVRSGIVELACTFWIEQYNLASLNLTCIALILKIVKPRKVVEYRHTSLCNVVYRIVAQTIANRLKPIISQIISPRQSAFIPNELLQTILLLVMINFIKLGIVRVRKKV